ncbi:MAG: 30S ribosomal protein S2 [Solitalea-like symbiont of Acarus siro]
MNKLSYEELLSAQVHFGHLTSKWNPKMAPYIFMEKDGVHLIDVNKTRSLLHNAGEYVKELAKSGRKILFVATKKQARDIVAAHAQQLHMPFVTERWLGGMLTNFATVRKSIKKMHNLDKMRKDEDIANKISKRERLQLTRDHDKKFRFLGGIADLYRLPAAIFVCDVKNEHLAIKEAMKLDIPVIAMVDTDSNPDNIKYIIPSNDDSTKSIALIVGYLSKQIEAGLNERKIEKEKVSNKEEVAL